MGLLSKKKKKGYISISILSPIYIYIFIFCFSLFFVYKSLVLYSLYLLSTLS